MESSGTVAISRKKQGVFWSAVGYTILLALILVIDNLGVSVDPFGLSQFIVVRLPAILILLLVMPRGPGSALAVTAGFTFLAVLECLSIFWGGFIDLAIPLLFAVAGLAFAIRSYARVQEKARGHIFLFILTLGGMFVWLWYAGAFIGTIDTLVRGTPEARSDAIMSLWYIVGLPILITILGGFSSRRAKRKR